MEADGTLRLPDTGGLTMPPKRSVGMPGSESYPEAPEQQMLGHREELSAIGLDAKPGVRVSVVIPALNEAANLPHVLSSLPGWIDEVVLVDGHSVDDTVAVAMRLLPNLKVVIQERSGKGDALLAGFSICNGDIIVTVDADGSTHGSEIPKFVSALIEGADLAKGSRFISGGGSQDITRVRRWGNWILSQLVNFLFGTHYTDLCYCFNAFWARHLEVLKLDCRGFEVETLISIRAARANLKVQEIPSFERPRVCGASNLHVPATGWQILKVISRECRDSRKGLSPNSHKLVGKSLVMKVMRPESLKHSRPQPENREEGPGALG